MLGSIAYTYASIHQGLLYEKAAGALLHHRLNLNHLNLNDPRHMLTIPSSRACWHLFGHDFQILTSDGIPWEAMETTGPSNKRKHPADGNARRLDLVARDEGTLQDIRERMEALGAHARKVGTIFPLYLASKLKVSQAEAEFQRAELSVLQSNGPPLEPATDNSHNENETLSDEHQELTDLSGKQRTRNMNISRAADAVAAAALSSLGS